MLVFLAEMLVSFVDFLAKVVVFFTPSSNFKYFWWPQSDRCWWPQSDRFWWLPEAAILIFHFWKMGFVQRWKIYGKSVEKVISAIFFPCFVHIFSIFFPPIFHVCEKREPQTNNYVFPCFFHIFSTSTKLPETIIKKEPKPITFINRLVVNIYDVYNSRKALAPIAVPVVWM